MIARTFASCFRGTRRAFTLVELLITVSIIGIMASMVLVAMFGATESAKRHKTEALIARIDAVIRLKWESYYTRRVPVVIPADMPPNVAARVRLDALRDLMRMELPDRTFDIIRDPTVFSYTYNPPSGGPKTISIQLTRPSVSQAYNRRYAALTAMNPDWPTGQHGGAECLYQILSTAAQEDDDTSAILRPDNVRDTDGDGAPEIIDAWGMPIKFLRWAPGFASERNTAAIAFTDTVNSSGSTVTIDAVTSFGMPGVRLPSALSTLAGSYTGASISARVKDPATNLERLDTVDPLSLGRVTGYQFIPPMTMTDNAIGKFVCTTPSWTMQKPFPGGSMPSGGQGILVLRPDPFDPQRVYPIYNPSGGTPPSPDTSVPSFALYPLVYSAGPNKCYGICADFDSGPTTSLDYTRMTGTKPPACNPFYVGTDGAVTPNVQSFIGAPREYPDEPNATTKGWEDNIHNHSLNQR